MGVKSARIRRATAGHAGSLASGFTLPIAILWVLSSDVKYKIWVCEPGFLDSLTRNPPEIMGFACARQAQNNPPTHLPSPPHGANVAPTTAVITGDGEAFYSRQFGQQVFSNMADVDRAIKEAAIKGDIPELLRLVQVQQEGIPTGQRALETAEFLVRNYVFVGQQRMVRNIVEAVRYNTDREAMERLGQVTAQHFNQDWGQALAGLLGFRTRRMDTAVGGISYRQALQRASADYRAGRITSQQYLARVLQIVRLGEDR